MGFEHDPIKPGNVSGSQLQPRLVSIPAKRDGRFVIKLHREVH